MPIYPTMAITSAIAVVAAELLWLRTGLFRQRAYWISMLIVFGFMIPVDGWLTKIPDPIVIYAPDDVSGWRPPATASAAPRCASTPPIRWGLRWPSFRP